METTKQMSFITAAQQFFGRQAGQTLLQFRDEVAKLTPQDKAEITEGLRAVGFDVK